jgi:hypothetical protein
VWPWAGHSLWDPWALSLQGFLQWHWGRSRVQTGSYGFHTQEELLCPYPLQPPDPQPCHAVCALPKVWATRLPATKPGHGDNQVTLPCCVVPPPQASGLFSMPQICVAGTMGGPVPSFCDSINHPGLLQAWKEDPEKNGHAAADCPSCMGGPPQCDVASSQHCPKQLGDRHSATLGRSRC